MQEQVNSVQVSEQDQPTTEPTPVPVPPPADQANAEEAQRKEADKYLKACIAANCKGERELLRGKLEAGQHAAQYVSIRLALGDSRPAAIQVLEGHLAMYSSDSVDANRLIGCWEAHRLLGIAQGLEDKAVKGLTWSRYYKGLMRLVERQHKDSPAETWVILPGLEEECKGLFAAVVDKGLSQQAMEDHVRNLEAKRAEMLEAAAKAEKDKAALEKDAALRKQQEAAKAAREAAEKAAEAKAAGKPEEAAALTQEAQKAAVEAAKAAREKEQAEAKEQAAQQEADKRAEQAAKKRQPRNTKPASKRNAPPAGDAPKGAQRPLPQVSNPSDDDPADIGIQCAMVIAECEEPETALEALLTQLLKEGELSKHGIKAANSALIILKRASEKTTSPAPTTAKEPAAESAAA